MCKYNEHINNIYRQKCAYIIYIYGFLTMSILEVNQYLIHISLERNMSKGQAMATTKALKGHLEIIAKHRHA